MDFKDVNNHRSSRGTETRESELSRNDFGTSISVLSILFSGNNFSKWPTIQTLAKLLAIVPTQFC